ncbi:uncharacterized protein [Dermacentor albipictus]
MVGCGVVLGLIAVGVLFFLTAMGTKAVKSPDASAPKGTVGSGASTAADNKKKPEGGGQVGARRRGTKRAVGDSTSDAAGTGTTGKPAERARKRDRSVKKGDMSTATHAVGSGNAVSWKSPSTTPSPPQRKQMTASPLVCVFGNRTDWKMHFPEDGLCDLVFYDSLYVHRGNTFQAGDNFTADLQRWLSAVKAYNVTEPGIAVTSMSVEKARSDASTTKGNATFRRLRAFGVRHYGVLDFHPTNLTEERYVQIVLRLFAKLRKMHDSHVPKGRGFKQYFAVGVTYVKHADNKVYTAIERAASKGEIQLVILRMHLGSRDEAIRGECLITGSTVWGKPVAEHHPSIESTLQYLRQRRSSFGESARLLVSVSLAGRWYTSLKGGNQKDAYAVGAKCKPFQFGTGLKELGSRVTACTEQHYAAHVTREERREVMSTYDGSTGLAFVFDSELTLYAKVCKARNALKDIRPIGLAVFDAEFDDWSNTCTSWNKFGNYTLMRTARKSVDAIGAHNATHVLDCATLPK